jgi:hypothetical protein
LNSPNFTFTYDLSPLSTSSDNYINMYYEPQINLGPNNSPIVYSYAQITINSANPPPKVNFDDIDMWNIDGNGTDLSIVGFVMMQKQFLSLNKVNYLPPLTSSNM